MVISDFLTWVLWLDFSLIWGYRIHCILWYLNTYTLLLLFWQPIKLTIISSQKLKLAISPISPSALMSSINAASLPFFRGLFLYPSQTESPKRANPLQVFATYQHGNQCQQPVKSQRLAPVHQTCHWGPMGCRGCPRVPNRGEKSQHLHGKRKQSEA